MRPSVRRMLPWAALAALALLALGGVPHLHDEVEGHGEHCVFCHAQDAPFVAPGLPANPDPVVRSTDVPIAAGHVHGMTPTGGGSRAPPA
ncbi:MAG: hypothetical protein F4Y20_08650 [Acidobacteria bacterium]|nr:hypothetical protein [Acidobacteriota bacterium]MYB32567.1 hypothetical protein [Acidobacteriota bacterium]MYE44572.1 hypothetical protein [Acidobacteriota bacterium]MYH21896.1 hypothetical protein [Acidobacteriota bacterium]MYK78599.1 hypothetical protein [Acidobacteriota bacterium]